VLEKYNFPDTDGVVYKAAAVEGEEAEEIEELDKSNESMKNDLRFELEIIVNFYSLSVQ